jgi:hypothetical protein
LKIRNNISLILILLLVPYIVNAEQIKFEAEGNALSLSENVPLDIQKQEAFVAAFVEGLSGIADKIVKFKKTPTTKSIPIIQKGVIISNKVFYAVRENISEFNVDTQTIIMDSEVTDYIINIDYKNHKYIVKNFQLISPPIEFIDFPKWNDPPKAVSSINIRDLKFKLENKEILCTLILSYIYDTAKVAKETRKKVEVKTLDFEFQRDNSNNYVFETVNINGGAYGGGTDTPDIIRKKALDDALRNAVEKVNGVFIQSLTEVENFQLTKDELISQTLGIANVIDKKFNPRFTSEGNYEIVCTVTAKVPIVRIVAK